MMESCANLHRHQTDARVSDVAFARLDCAVSLEDLQADIAALPGQSWLDHVNRGDYQGDWNVLPLRCARKHVSAHPLLRSFAIAGIDEWQDLPLLQDCPAVREVLAGLCCPLKAVRLMRLCAGAFIKPHRDLELAIEYDEARLHLPIHTSDDVRFIVDRQKVPMRAGELWYINVDREHEVRNTGKTDRINLVIDCVANDWLRERVYSSGVLSGCLGNLA